MSASGHWFLQRSTSVVLIPLGLWLLWAVTSLAGADHAFAAEFMSRPLNALAAAALAALGLYHAQLGLQVIIEDYVPGTLFPRTLLLMVRVFCLAMALAVFAALFKLAFGV